MYNLTIQCLCLLLQIYLCYYDCFVQGHIYYMRTVGSVDREYVLFNKNKLYFQNDIIFFPNIVSGGKSYSVRTIKSLFVHQMYYN